MTVKELTEKFCEGVTSAANKRIDEIYFSLGRMTGTVEKIDELIEHFKNTYYYLIEYSFEEEEQAAFFKIQRTEFSKQECFYFILAYTPIDITRVVTSFAYIKAPARAFDYITSSVSKLNNEELIEKLERIKRFDEGSIRVLTDIIKSSTSELKCYGIEPEEPELIKPKGNPYSGESWRDKKHRFKGGR